MARFKVVGYDFYRNSANKIYTHATIHINNGREVPILAESFHISLEAAEKDAQTKSKYSHLEFVAIVPVEQVEA